MTVVQQSVTVTESLRSLLGDRGRITKQSSACIPVSVGRHTHPFNGPFFWDYLEKPIWILLKQETVSGSGISWAICR